MGHVLGQACGFIVAIGHHRLVNVDIDQLLSAIRGRHKAVEALMVLETNGQGDLLAEV